MRGRIGQSLVAVLIAWAAAPGQAADPVQPPAVPPDAVGPACAPPSAEPLPPLAVPPTEQHPSGLWENLVALHNAYVYRHATLDLGAEPPPPPLCLHVFADAGFYFLQPYFESNPSSTFTRHSTTDGGVATTATRTDEFSYDPGFSPRVELGVIGNSGWGARVGWWQFDQVARTRPTADLDTTGSTTLGSAPVEGVPGFVSPSAAALKFGVFKELLTFDTHFKSTNVDAEAIDQVRTDIWTVLLSGGVRYTYLSQDYEANRFNSGSGKSGKTRVNVTQDFDIVDEGHSFAGVGPTAAVDASRPIGSLGFGLYGMARTSILFGTGKVQSFQSSRTTVEPTSSPTARPLLSTKLLAFNDGTQRDDVLPVGEVEVGGEWARRFGGVGVFVRVGLVGQSWLGAGNATGESGDLGLFGMTLTGGLEY